MTDHRCGTCARFTDVRSASYGLCRPFVSTDHTPWPWWLKTRAMVGMQTNVHPEEGAGCPAWTPSS